MNVRIIPGDCIAAMAELPADSVDAIVCDPPYGLEFMGKEWDSFKGANDWGRAGESPEWQTLPKGGGDPFSKRDTPRFTAGQPFQQWCQLWATEALRVLKPGGHMLAFGGTRTWHRLACAVEDAGFEIRDSIAWLYGSGFPKSLDVSKAIDKAAGATREVTGRTKTPFKVDAAAFRGTSLQGSVNGDFSKQVGEDGYRYTEHTAPATEAAQQWSGFGTALKPAFEPVVVARKPLAAGTVAGNVLAYGTGALNIDGCRIEGNAPSVPRGSFAGSNNNMAMDGRNGTMSEPHAAGRWPANVVLDESQAEALDQQSGILNAKGRYRNPDEKIVRGARGGSIEKADFLGFADDDTRRNDYANEKGGASRFFYCAKAPASERPTVDGVSHATVKPLALMRWLVRLVTPPGGTVLDPFAGSGTTVEAAMLEGFDVIGIEREADYLPLIQQRIDRATATLAALAAMPVPEPDLFSDTDADGEEPPKPSGRWPANVILDRSQAEALDEQSGSVRSSGMKSRSDSDPNRNLSEVQFSNGKGFAVPGVNTYSDQGGASRFYYVADEDDE